MSAFAKIEVENAYRGTILDAVAGKTTNGFPQAVLRLRAEEAANEKGEFEKLAAPAQITAYCTLFNSTEVCNEQTQNLNYAQLKKIGGWDDHKFSFTEIAKLTGKQVFFRTAFNTYTNKQGVSVTNMQVAWIDEYDSDGTTNLRGATSDELKAMDSLLKFSGAQGGLPGSAAPTTARRSPRKAAPEAANPTSSIAAPSILVQPAALATKSAPPEPVAAVTDAPAECTKMEAWEYLNEQCAAHGDAAISQAWLTAIKKIGGVQNTYTGKEWARVRDEARGALIPY